MNFRAPNRLRDTREARRSSIVSGSPQAHIPAGLYCNPDLEVVSSGEPQQIGKDYALFLLAALDCMGPSF